ncbi:MAG: MBL fold metallo-hydrolase [Candidatus Thorarchaeota archaeon]
MKFLQNFLSKSVLVGIFIVTSGVVITAGVLTTNSDPIIHVNLLFNAGVMIETEDTRIYIDPYELPSSYSNYPADAIFVTHDHGDHYDPTSIDVIKTENTSLYFPAIMSEEALVYGAHSVVPEDTFSINHVNVRCFYMYTMPGSNQSSHPQEYNYTSYLIEIEGFTIFHAGDSWNIEEYEQLTGEVDLALLPLGPGCQTMTGVDVLSAILTIEPTYFIPIHYTEDYKETFLYLYSKSIENLNCTLIDLDYFESYTFNQQTTTMDTTTTDTIVATTDDTTRHTTTENGSNTPGFSFIAVISAGVFLLIRRIRRRMK